MAASFTGAQKDCIESTASRLVISAGAGTGKTFTITQKIAYMMEHGLLDSVEEVLAITFTTKAAGEIKARVRSTLRAKGLLEEALLVDGAWVGTIHGMCSRMLKEHALEIGISPAFSVLDDIDAANLLKESLEETLASEEGGPGDYRTLFSEYPKRGDVTGIVMSLIAQAKKSPKEFESIVAPPMPRSPQEIASQLLMSLQEARDVYDACGWNSKSLEEALGWTAGAIDVLGALCERMRADDSGRDFLAETEEALASIGVPKKIRGSKYPDVVEHSVQVAFEFDRACAELEGNRARTALGQALDLAARAAQAYGQKKRERGLMDNDDLLVTAYRALSTVPGMADHYRNKFRLVLVDEFQDTSELQIGIINLITGPRTQLCTVGDAQQSIYRFRGADVNVYRRFIKNLGVAPVELGKNFRSHEDILRFSNAIFGLPGVFDDMYLPLEPGRDAQPGPFHGMPRVEAISVQYPYRQATTDDMRRYEAAQVAERFSRFRDAGVRAGDMVVLMGRMTASLIYADALAAEGFEVVIAGGSGFWSSGECAMVESVLRVLANPRDNEALYWFLESGIVPIGDGDLVSLVSAGNGRRRRLSDGFAAVGEGDSSQLRQARRLVDEAAENLSRRGIAEAIERMLAESGMAERLGAGSAAGSASWANVLKALRFVKQFEDEKGLGVSGVASLFAQHRAEASKEGPGFLAAESGNAVRIMTIHASKGLEFPVVALVEYASTWAPSGLHAQTADGNTYVLLDAGSKSGPAGGLIHKRAAAFSKALAAQDDDTGKDWAGRLAASRSYGGYLAALNAYGRAEDLAEAKRKFYVGVTRASEALVVGASHQMPKNGLPAGELLDDLCRAIFGKNAFPTEDCAFDFGGSAPGRYSYVGLQKDTEGNVAWAGNDDYRLPEAPASERPSSMPPEGSGLAQPMDASKAVGDGRFFSYSSIAQHIDMPIGMPGEDDGAGEALMSDEDSATEFGLAFHAAAEHMASLGFLGGGVSSGDHEPAGTGIVAVPEKGRLEALARLFALSEVQAARLGRAVGVWAGSESARRAAGYKRVRPEVPFCLEFPVPGREGDPFLINGEIDLLCSNPGEAGAFIVDYKTGGRDDETPEFLQEKHRLQSLCYAYAALTAEFESVEIAFVRVERMGADGQPETVGYAYRRDDLPEIAERISAALEASR